MKKFLFWQNNSHKIHRDNILETVVQALIIGVSALVILFFTRNYIANISARNISLGFDFLKESAGYQIGQSLIDYQESDPYYKVYIVGLLNTLLATVLAVILATVLGFVVGLSLLSSNWLLQKVASLYVEVLRNVPPLLHVLFWYVVVILQILPDYKDSIHIGNLFYLNVRGLTMPELDAHDNMWIFVVFAIIAIVGLIYFNSYAKKRTAQGHPMKVWYWNVSALVVLIILKFTISPFEVIMPVAGKFKFTTGFTLAPELFAIVVALASYTSTYIGTIVKSSILSIPKSQIESSHSLGLSYFQRLQYVTIPLALRSMIPPLTNQYLNILKNSSLGVAIGYSEVVAVFAGTALNQTGRAVEIMAIVMLTYLSISLFTSWLMNIYNKKIMK